MKRGLYSFGIAFFVATGVARGQQEPPTPLQIIVSQSVRSQTTVNDQQLDLAGRLNLHLVASEEDLAQDVMHVAGLDLAYFGVPMAAFTKIPPRFGDDGTGVLSASVMSQPRVQVLHGFAFGLAILFGQWDAVVEVSQLGDLQQKRTGAVADERDAVHVAPTQKGTLFLLMAVREDDLRPGLGGGEGEPGILDSVGSLFVAFQAQELTVGNVRIPPYLVTQSVLTPIKTQFTWLSFEVVRRLCLQPVRMGRITITGGWPFPIFSVDFTGKGLPFGQPGADTQWRKGDVIFEWRPWKTIWNASYFTLNIAAGEDATLRGEVNDSDCIEVFFVDTFDTPSTWGGGATFSSGLASAKVISSDDNSEAVCAGVACNKTHLAHELGHVMTLHHPGVGALPPMIDGTTGTLMCPSGFVADNPRRNSVTNENNVNNPLFQMLFSVSGPAPDCTTNATCGPCFTVTTP